MPRAGVVACAVAGAGEHLHREARPRPDVAVGDDLGALGQADEAAHVRGAAALEDALEREIDGAGDVTVPRVAVRGRGAVELGRRPDVEEREARSRRPACRAARPALRPPLAHEVEEHGVEPLGLVERDEVPRAREHLEPAVEGGGCEPLGVLDRDELVRVSDADEKRAAE